jgi:hypothetical protein
MYLGSCGSNCSTGAGNSVSGEDSFLGAGDQNVVGAPEAFIGSGATNTISSSATYAAIVGGSGNLIKGGYGTIGGGHDNSVGGLYATVPGGGYDAANGEFSLAAGYHASAGYAGSFVWSDFTSGSSVLKDTAKNEFVVRASGGVYLYSSENISSGVHLAAGSGTWASLSDRNSKTDIAPLDDAAVLAKVAALPVSVWRYKTERGVRHVGPMAQDFYAAFGVGEDDRHITSIDEDGVALAAIKALHAENASLRERLARSDARFAELERKVEALSQTQKAPRQAGPS